MGFAGFFFFQIMFSNNVGTVETIKTIMNFGSHCDGLEVGMAMGRIWVGF